MADHVRTQIRDRVISAGVLGNLTTSGSRVYRDRVTALSDTDIGAGALVVFCGDEPDPEILTLNPRKYGHQMPLHVDLYQHSTGDFAKTLDTMEAEVDAALIGDYEATKLNGLVKDCVKGVSDREFDGEGNKPAGVRRLTYMIEYHTLAASPTVVAP